MFCAEHWEDIEKGRVIIWMQDECHQLWGDCCGYVWGKRGVRLSIPMTDFRKRQTWYGALNCLTGEFSLSPHENGDTKNTVEFVERLYMTDPSAQHVILWDGASHHRSKEFMEYLERKNKGLSRNNFRILCIPFAPNAPEQNSAEDIWLQGKTEVRKRFNEIRTFDDAKEIFQDFIEGGRFFLEKTKAYLPL